MTILKLIPILIMIVFLFACGSENAPSTNTVKTSDSLFEEQRKVLEDAKDVEKVLADEEQKRKDKIR
jgi:type II restriction/modification system DNA methylase subunit YeeA